MLEETEEDEISPNNQFKKVMSNYFLDYLKLG
jgi:abortive infection bacteriophage resistance protein